MDFQSLYNLDLQQTFFFFAHLTPFTLLVTITWYCGWITIPPLISFSKVPVGRAFSLAPEAGTWPKLRRLESQGSVQSGIWGYSWTNESALELGWYYLERGNFLPLEMASFFLVKVCLKMKEAEIIELGGGERISGPHHRNAQSQLYPGLFRYVSQYTHVCACVHVLLLNWI